MMPNLSFKKSCLLELFLHLCYGSLWASCCKVRASELSRFHLEKNFSVECCIIFLLLL